MPIDVVVTRFVQQNVGGLRKDLATLGGDFAVLESRISRAEASGARAAAVGAVSLGIIATITKRSLEAAGQVQRVETGFMTVLKDANKAQQLSQQIRKFDVETSFSYLESAKSSQMLLAAGFRDDLIPTMYAVGNAVIAAGKGTDTFTRALAIMAKIKTSGVLTGVRVHQFAAAGINVKDILKKQLGLTDDEMINIGRLKLKADVVIPALIKGLNEEFGDGIERAKNSYLGSLEIMKGSTDKAFASIGKIINKDATTAVKAITALIDKVDEFVRYHPRLIRTGLAVGAIASTSAVIYGSVTAFKMAAQAKTLLERATRKDIAAESTKAVIAAKEAAAVAGVGTAAASTAGKVGILANVSNQSKNALSWLKTPLKTPPGVMGPLMDPNALRVKSSGYWQNSMTKQTFTPAQVNAGKVADANMLKWVDTTSYRMQNAAGKWVFVKRSVGQAYQAELAAQSAMLNASKPTGIAKILANTTRGAVLGGVLTGIGTGLDSNETLSKLGVDDAGKKAGLLGVSAAVASMFVPGAAIPIAIASGFAGIFNMLYNRPREQAAEDGSGFTPEQQNKFNNSNRFQRAKMYEDEAEKLNQKISDTQDRYNSGMYFFWQDPQQEMKDDYATMESYRHQARVQRNAHRNDQITARAAAEQASIANWRQQQDDKNRRERLLYEERTESSGYVPVTRYSEDHAGNRLVNPRNSPYTNHRDDSSTVQVHIPARKSDVNARNQRFRTFTPRT